MTTAATTTTSAQWKRFLSDLRGQLDGSPEWVLGPEGQRLSLSWQRDPERGGAEYVIVGIHELPAIFEVVPGVTVSLRDLRVYVRKGDS